MGITKGKIKITKISGTKIKDKRTDEITVSDNYELNARYPGQKTSEELDNLGYEILGWEGIETLTIDLDLAVLFAAGK